jgi:hypothetical protein
VRDLAKTVVCRNYASAVLELCHLIHIADACGRGQGFAFFFWDSGPARSSAFRGYVSQSLNPATGRRTDFSADSSGVTITYGDGVFSVTYSRMPFLSALLELLITTVGYRELDGLFTAMLADPGRENTSRHANQLSKVIYDYLKEHLPTAQIQRKFRRLIAFLEDRFGASFEPSAIDDRAVMDFWLSESGRDPVDGVDFKTFLAVFKGFTRLRQTLDQGAGIHALEAPMAIGTDREAGEIEPDAVLGIVETVDEYRSPLLSLQEPPADAVKFLNKREMAVVDLLMDSGPVALSLPLSLIRCEVFGRAQGQITQALRRKAGSNELGALIDNGASQTYLERKEEFRRISFHMDRVLKASLHALAGARNREAILLVLTLRPDIDFAPLAALLDINESGGDNVVMLRATAVSDHFLSVIEDADRVGPDIAGLMAEGRKAFRGLARQGFGNEDANDPIIVEGFVKGSRALKNMRGQVSAFLERLDQMALPCADWEGQFTADKERFAEQFLLLYGGNR